VCAELTAILQRRSFPLFFFFLPAVTFFSSYFQRLRLLLGEPDDAEPNTVKLFLFSPSPFPFLLLLPLRSKNADVVGGTRKSLLSPLSSPDDVPFFLLSLSGLARKRENRKEKVECFLLLPFFPLLQIGNDK